MHCNESDEESNQTSKPAMAAGAEAQSFIAQKEEKEEKK